MKTVLDLERVAHLTMEAAAMTSADGDDMYGAGTASEHYPRYVHKVATTFAQDTYAVERNLYYEWSNARTHRHALQKAASQAAVLSILQAGQVVIFPSEQEIAKYVTSELPVGYVDRGLGLQRLFAVRLNSDHELYISNNLTSIPSLCVIPFKVGVRAATSGGYTFDWIADAALHHKRWLTPDAFSEADDVTTFIERFVSASELYRVHGEQESATLFLAYMNRSSHSSWPVRRGSDTAVRKILDYIDGNEQKMLYRG